MEPRLVITQRTKVSILKTATYLALVDMFKSLDNPKVIEGKVETTKNAPVCGNSEVLVTWEALCDLENLGFDLESFHSTANLAEYFRMGVCLNDLIALTIENIYERDKSLDGAMIRKMIKDMENGYSFHEKLKTIVESIEAELYLHLGKQGAVSEESLA